MEIVGHSLLGTEAREQMAAANTGKNAWRGNWQVSGGSVWVPSNPASVRNSPCLNHRENLPTSMNFTSRSSARFSREDWWKTPRVCGRWRDKWAFWKIPGHSVLFNKDCPQGKRFYQRLNDQKEEKCPSPVSSSPQRGGQETPKADSVKDWGLMIGLYI